MIRLAAAGDAVQLAALNEAFNGPGEAKGADIALCGGDRAFLLYEGGEMKGKVSEQEAVQAVLDAVRRWM